jgi:Uma2 family endonuclease
MVVMVTFLQRSERRKNLLTVIKQVALWVMPFDAKTLQAAAELGVRLEYVNGLAIWEAQPLYRHQKAVERIAQSIRPGARVANSACVHALDVYVQFPDGLKRPDISVFCREPTEEEQDAALTMIPEAVIEVVSRGFESKDLEIGPSFYLSQGVKDVVVFDPATQLVLHVTKSNAVRSVAPQEIALACGCNVTVG